jgi:hypothetical protein
MAQQDVSKVSGELFRRVLYGKSPLGYIPIAAGNLCGDTNRFLGRIVEEYTPPTPTYKTAELKILGGTSRFHGSGIASYRIELKIYFKDNVKYAEFMHFLKNSLKYYDENGYIYYCYAFNEPVVERMEAGMKYFVKLTLQGVKKDTHEEDFAIKFADVEGNMYEQDILEIAAFGLVRTLSETGYIYTYRPNAYVTRAELITFFNRLRKTIQKAIQ